MEKPQPLTGKELVVDCAEDTLNKRYKMYSKGWQNKKNCVADKEALASRERKKENNRLEMHNII